MPKSIPVLYKVKILMSKITSRIVPYTVDLLRCVETQDKHQVLPKIHKNDNKKPYQESTNPLFIQLNILKLKDFVDHNSNYVQSI